MLRSPPCPAEPPIGSAVLLSSFSSEESSPDELVRRPEPVPNLSGRRLPGSVSAPSSTLRPPRPPHRAHGELLHAPVPSPSPLPLCLAPSPDTRGCRRADCSPEQLRQPNRSGAAPIRSALLSALQRIRPRLLGWPESPPAIAGEPLSAALTWRRRGVCVAAAWSRVALTCADVALTW